MKRLPQPGQEHEYILLSKYSFIDYFIISKANNKCSVPHPFLSRQMVSLLYEDAGVSSVDHFGQKPFHNPDNHRGKVSPLNDIE